MDHESHEPSAGKPVRGTGGTADTDSALTPALSSVDEPTYRRDGWTPFARKLFLEVLSETGRVSLACEYAQLSKQSAYALRARDPVFAAGWDAACELAPAPLADALYERAVEGVTETITRDGEVVATRHRHDSRLSIAVLHRLDKRCDRAAENGAHHLELVRHWDEWLALVGEGEDQTARALLEPAPHGQLGQLPLGENPTSPAKKPVEIDLSDRCWEDEDGVWRTSFPPPPRFTGYQTCEWGDPATVYDRECTADEIAILEADAAALRAHERAEQEALRDRWFAMLRDELAPDRLCELDASIADTRGEEAAIRPDGSGSSRAAPQPSTGIG